MECDFVLEQQLSQGTYIGRDNEGRMVVIKSIDKTIGNKGIFSEIDVSRRIIHQNVIHAWSVVIPLVCSTSDIWLLYEPSMMSLGDYIGLKINLDNYRNLALNIINGCGFLHSVNIAHCNITPENVLLVSDTNGNTTAKLSNFYYSIMTYDINTKLLDSIGCASTILQLYTAKISSDNIFLLEEYYHNYNNSFEFEDLLNKKILPEEFMQINHGTVKSHQLDGLNIFEHRQDEIFKRTMTTLTVDCVRKDVSLQRALNRIHNLHRYFQYRKKNAWYYFLQKYDGDNPEFIRDAINLFSDVVHGYTDEIPQNMTDIISAIIHVYGGVLYTDPILCCEDLYDLQRAIFNLNSYFIEKIRINNLEHSSLGNILLSGVRKTSGGYSFIAKMLNPDFFYDNIGTNVSVPQVSSGTMKVEI
jgi:serine/threonine protein kinase